MTSKDPVVIVGSARTPMGAFQGAFRDMAASKLGGVSIAAALERAEVKASEIEENIFGCVLSAGQGQAPARQAGFAGGLPMSCGATTVNKMCGSGMKAAMLAHDMLVAGSNTFMVAGGMENMSKAPYLLDKARGGYRMGHGRLIDHMFLDGLEDAYDHGRLMGTYAEDCAEQFAFTRQAQDAYAVASLERANAAIKAGRLTNEIAPVDVKIRNETQTVTTDEQPPKAQPNKIPLLKPAFRDNGTVTAANSSSISDGAAALVMTRLSVAEKRGIQPLARICATTTFADGPALFPTAPIGALKQLSQLSGWPLESVDLFEINEAFAVVVMAAMKVLDLPHDKVNVHGGACALGHPIGASGARIIVSLLSAMQQYQLKRGMAVLCIGGGEATAMAFERM